MIEMTGPAPMVIARVVLADVERYLAVLCEHAEDLPPAAAGVRILHERVERALAKLPEPEAPAYDPVPRAIVKGAPGDSWDPS